MDEARASWERGQRGDFRRIDRALAELEQQGGPEARAWDLALRALRWHAQPEHGSLPALDEVAALAEGSTGPRLAAALTCAQVERACVLALDRDSLVRWVDLHGSLLRGYDDREAVLSHEAARCWLQILGGPLGGGGAAIDRLAAESSRARIPTLVIEAATLRALAAMGSGDLEAALATARRASRMARTEALPQQEYLANLVLARLRRMTQRPHLAVRILAALARVAPRPWAGWLSWELRLAGDEATAATLSGGVTGPGEALVTDHALVAAESFGRAVEAAGSGDRARFSEELSRTRAAVAPCPWLLAELEAARIALDPDADVADASPELLSWVCGASTEPPTALAGLCTVADAAAASESAAAWVLSRPPRGARRVLARGLGLAGDEARRIQKLKRKKGRTDTCLAVLALAGPTGMTREELFRSVYGFQYSAVLHQGVLDTMLHRLRARVEPSGAIHRDGDRIVLRLGEPLIVPDPRCTSTVDGAVLRLLATQTIGTAKEAAQALGVPLRTAQAALQQLVSDGALISERRGNQVAYRVEDTTFSEPTRY